VKRVISSVSALFVTSLVLFGVSPLGAGRFVQAATFDPGNVVADTFFTANEAMSVSDIQNFLIQEGSILATIDPSQLGNPSDVQGRSAAQIIYDASNVSRTDFGHAKGYGPNNPLVMNLNPEVILITLQKEQSLITGTYVSGNAGTTAALATAMGYGCPDSGGCNANYAGFVDQVTYAAAQLMMDYYQAASSTYQPGQTYTFTNTQGPPYNAPATQQVVVGDASTSALYQYTPHVYNGNYNFWYYQNLWFSGPINTFSPTALMIKTADSVQVYVTNANQTEKWPLASLAYATAWGINPGIQILTDAQVAAIPDGIGAISRLQKGSRPDVYYIENGHKFHIASDAQFPIWGLNWSELAQVDDSALDQLPTGAPLGLLAKSATQTTVYLITYGHKYYVPDIATMAAWGFTFASIDTIPQSVIDGYPSAGNLTDLATFEGSPDVYVMSNGQALYAGSQSQLSQWNLTFGMLCSVGKEMAAIEPKGPNFSLVAKGSGPSVYYIQGGLKRYVTSWSHLAAVGASQGQLITVSDALLGTLANGANL
jgi:hypothetical protein